MRHFNSRLLMLVLAGSLAASTALGQTPQPTITSVQGSYIGTASPMATSVTAGVTGVELTITGTNFGLFGDVSFSELVWVPSTGGCPVRPVGHSCVLPAYHGLRLGDCSSPS